MRKWKTILWIVVLSFLSVSCGSRETDPTQQIVGNPNGNLGRLPGSGGNPPFGPPPGIGNGGTGYGTSLPVVYGADGVFLGSLVAAGADPDSLCFQGGEFGSMASSTSIWNFYSAYGSPTSPLSVNNPAATTPPTICYWDGAQVTNCFAFISKNRNLGYQTYDPDMIRRSVCSF